MNNSIVHYTGSFYTMHKIPEGYTPISIALGSPSFYRGESIDCFKPTWNLINQYKSGSITEEEYIDKYFTLLEFRMGEVSSSIEYLRNKKVVYLCHEPSGSFCHRHLVSKLLNKLGIACHELV